MSDLISRQAVIQMLNTVDRYVADSLRLCDTDETFPQNEVFIVDDMYESLDQLPSVQPERNFCRTCKWVTYYGDVDKYGNVESAWYCRNWEGGTDEEGFCYEWEAKMEGEHGRFD